MGLPMFREPEEEPADRVVTKVDKAAATSRSAIRRESTVRPARSNVISSPLSHVVNHLHLLEDYHSHHLYSRPVAESDEAELEAEAERPRRRRETRSRIRWRFLNRNEGDDRDRQQAGEELLGDALQHDRPGQRLRLLRPSRESALRFEVAPSPPLSESDSFSTSPRLLAYSIQRFSSLPWFDGHRESLSPDGPLPPHVPFELTPGFAPAQGVYHGSDRVSVEIMNATTSSAANDGDEIPDLETPPPEMLEASYPPLRRVGHLSPRPYSFRHDGLGDRQRSPGYSANDYNGEEDTWETLLTTMEEDENQPSAESSFTSAIASASTSRRSESASRSGRSSQTIATSLGDIGPADAEHPCDSDHDQDETQDFHDSTAPSVIRSARIRPGQYSSRSRASNGQHETFERVRDAARDSIAVAERRIMAAEERLRRMQSRAAATEAEVAQMQSFIDRLARREDIPNEL